MKLFSSDKLVCVEHLSEARRRWLAENDMARLEEGWNILNNSPVVVGGRRYRQYVWSQRTPDQTLIVFELVRSAILGSVHYCLGAELLGEGKIRLLSDKDLWEEGIP